MSLKKKIPTLVIFIDFLVPNISNPQQFLSLLCIRYVHNTLEFVHHFIAVLTQKCL